MRSHFPHFPRAAQRERGAVLIVALMFLVVLTLLGLSTMTTTTLEEKMSGNSRDYNVALQSAEATLRDAENDIKASGTTGRTLTVVGFTSLCPAGLCAPATVALQMSGSADWSSSSTTTVTYGAQTSAAAIPAVGTQPRYMIELLPGIKAKLTGPSTTVDAFYLRITAYGYGANSNTLVKLQSVYVTPLQAGF
jgi:type IV pilus assembly protein PilX